MSVFLRDDVKLAINEVLNVLCDISTSSKDHVLKNEKNGLALKTPLQICMDYKFDDALRSSIHKVIIEHCFKAETISPGSFIKTLHLVKKNLAGTISSIGEYSVTPRTQDVKNMISSMSDDHVLNRMIFEAITLAGFRGNISVEKSLNSTSSVELIDGYKFKHKPLAGLKPVKISKPKVIVIDGYVESVSEINKLLQEASESKHQLLLMTRGMHEDVITTCKVNRDRSTMFVYPIIIEFDIDGINTINDICVVSGCLPISQNLGNLISEASLTHAAMIDECTIIGNSIIIKNSKTKTGVLLHTKSLIQKRNDSVSGVDDLLTNRIKSLTNSNVIIRLPDDASYVYKSQIIDYALRSFKSALDYGFVNENLFATESVSISHSEMIIRSLDSIASFLC